MVIFSLVAKNRFDFLLTNLCLDDKSTRAERKVLDTFSPRMEIWDFLLTVVMGIMPPTSTSQSKNNC